MGLQVLLPLSGIVDEALDNNHTGFSHFAIAIGTGNKFVNARCQVNQLGDENMSFYIIYIKLQIP